MSLVPRKPCAYPSCGRLTDRRYCPRCAQKVDRDRAKAQPWRRNYFTSRWARMRMKVLRAALFRCQCSECQGRYITPPATVVHHSNGHGPDVFWSEEWLVAMSKRCHDRLTMTEQQDGRRAGEGSPA